jgi:hypothetical protein
MPEPTIAATVIVIALAVASRPIEVRLWRSGRISTRTLMLLMVGRFPVLVAVFGVLAGGSILLIAFIEVLLVPPIYLGYRLLRHLIGDVAVSPDRDHAVEPHRL